MQPLDGDGASESPGGAQSADEDLRHSARSDAMYQGVAATRIRTLSCWEHELNIR
jgi:hypothetical protein